MKVIVDTCIWSLALRRATSKNNIITQQLAGLINDFRVQMIGPIRQEILSGVCAPEQFTKLKKYLDAFIDLPVHTNDYEQAASYFNLCRKKGIQGSHTDFLICSLAVNNNLSIFTTDKDFIRYKECLPINLLD